jgi:hypothetical protein
VLDEVIGSSAIASDTLWGCSLMWHRALVQTWTLEQQTGTLEKAPVTNSLLYLVEYFCAW